VDVVANNDAAQEDGRNKRITSNTLPLDGGEARELKKWTGLILPPVEAEAEQWPIHGLD
jgi:hypothetical protein